MPEESRSSSRTNQTPSAYKSFSSGNSKTQRLNISTNGTPVTLPTKIQSVIFRNDCNRSISVLKGVPKGDAGIVI